MKVLIDWVDGGNAQNHKNRAKEVEGSYRNGTSNASRSHERAKTFKGIARAVAEQWSIL